MLERPQKLMWTQIRQLFWTSKLSPYDMKIYRDVVQQSYFQMQKESLESDIRQGRSDASKSDPEQKFVTVWTATRVQFWHDFWSSKHIQIMTKLSRYEVQQTTFPTKPKTLESDFVRNRGGITKLGTELKATGNSKCLYKTSLGWSPGPLCLTK